VLPIWEGTTNALLDVLRGSPATARRHRCWPAWTRPPVPHRWWRGRSRPSYAGREELAAVAADPYATVVLAGARGLALRLGYALAAALLVEHAGRGYKAAGTAAQLWTRSRLAGEDVSVAAHEQLDALC
jgi:hypothetical protein